MGRTKLLRSCIDCQSSLPRSEFAHTQWKLQDDVRICRECVSKRNKDRALKELKQEGEEENNLHADDDDDEEMIIPAKKNPNTEIEDYGESSDDEYDHQPPKSTATTSKNKKNRGIIKDKRLERNKKRRARMTVLFNELADVVGLSAASDRGDVIDEAIKTIKRMKCIDHTNTTTSNSSNKPNNNNSSSSNTTPSSPDISIMFEKDLLNGATLDLLLQQQQHALVGIEPLVSLSTLELPDDIFDEFITHAPRA
jgi:hypothetical protein